MVVWGLQQTLLFFWGNPFVLKCRLAWLNVLTVEETSQNPSGKSKIPASALNATNVTAAATLLNVSLKVVNDNFVSVVFDCEVAFFSYFF